MVIGQVEIDFHRVKIFDDKYILQPHVSLEPQKFLDTLTSPKIFKIFVVCELYADFIPKIAYHIALLFPVLRKNPPP